MKDDAVTFDNDELRKQAVYKLRRQRGFRTHALVYLLTNAFISLIWFFADRHGFYWPLWIEAFWGIFLVVNGVNSYRPQTFSEDQIKRQMDRMKPAS
ncbi:MAG TPA: 2TM domain-containing protein [Mycobacteriales bacterium]|nr:2TM domain-containing protein [Mycobacteriales bacterium]